VTPSLLRLACGAIALAGAVAPAWSGGVAAARDGVREDRDRGERVELRVPGVCGRRSAAHLRLRAEDGRIRTDLRVRTATLGRWRVDVLHERRLVRRVRVRATRAARGFEFRVVLPDYAGPDAVRVRAVSRRGEVCTTAATVPGS
jgi:hypothetical protein